MKFSSAFATGMAVLLILPHVAPGQAVQGSPRTLEQLLADATRALESMRRLESEIANAPPLPAAIDAGLLARLQQQTSPAMEDERAASEHLDLLRLQVGGLETQLDAQIEANQALPSNPGALQAIPRTKWNASERVSGQALPTQAVPDIRRQAAPGPGATSVAPPGYSADPLRQAQVCLRANKAERALALLEQAPAGASVQYWKGRALEKLGRDQEALESYRLVSSFAHPGLETERAQSAIEFLEWKLALDQKTGERVGATPPGAGAP